MAYTVHGILQARILEEGSLFLLQGIFPTQGSNPGLLHCRQILYHLSHKYSPLFHFTLYIAKTQANAMTVYGNKTKQNSSSIHPLTKLTAFTFRFIDIIKFKTFSVKIILRLKTNENLIYMIISLWTVFTTHQSNLSRGSFFSDIEMLLRLLLLLSHFSRVRLCVTP